MRKILFFIILFSSLLFSKKYRDTLRIFVWDNDRGAKYSDPENPRFTIGTEYYIIKCLEIYASSSPRTINYTVDTTLLKARDWVTIYDWLRKYDLVIILFGGRWYIDPGWMERVEDTALGYYFLNGGRIWIIGADFSHYYGYYIEPNVPIFYPSFLAQQIGIGYEGVPDDYSQKPVTFEGRPGTIYEGISLRYPDPATPYNPKSFICDNPFDPSGSRIPLWHEYFADIVPRGKNNKIQKKNKEIPWKALGNDINGTGKSGNLYNQPPDSDDDGKAVVWNAEFSALKDSTTGTKYEVFRRTMDFFFSEMLFVYDPGIDVSKPEFASIRSFYDDTLFLPLKSGSSVSFNGDTIWGYDIFQISEDGSFLRGPTAKEMSNYSFVVWYTGSDPTYTFTTEDTIAIDSLVRYYHVPFVWIQTGLREFFFTADGSVPSNHFVRRILGIDQVYIHNWPGGDSLVNQTETRSIYYGDTLKITSQITNSGIDHIYPDATNNAFRLLNYTVWSSDPPVAVERDYIYVADTIPVFTYNFDFKDVVFPTQTLKAGGGGAAQYLTGKLIQRIHNYVNKLGTFETYFYADVLSDGVYLNFNMPYGYESYIIYRDNKEIAEFHTNSGFLKDIPPSKGEYRYKIYGILSKNKTKLSEIKVSYYPVLERTIVNYRKEGTLLKIFSNKYRTLNIYDITGRKALKIDLRPGENKVYLNNKKLKTGIYFIKLSDNKQKVLVIK